MPYDHLRNEVRVVLGGSEVFVVERYQVTLGIIDQPCAFAVELGNGAVAKKLKDKFPPNTKFELHIGGVKQFAGRTDGWTIQGGPGGTVLVLRGRDALAPVVDGFVTSEKSWSDATYATLCKAALDATIGAGKYKLAVGNDGNRKAISGATGESKPSEFKSVQELFGGDPGVQSPKTTQKTIQAKVGMRWYSDFLKPQLDRAGLFLFAAGSTEDEFILTTPNANQSPYVSILHRRDDLNNQVKSYVFKNEPTARYSRCDVHGRRGGGEEPRSKVFGTFRDTEMESFGIDRPMVLHDDKCTTVAQAEFLAKRRIAEARREAWSLEYHVAGHVTPAIGGGSAVWIPDTVIDVTDDELDLHGPYYLESVVHEANPQAETTLRLMRPEDVVFATEGSSDDKTAKKNKKFK